MNPPAPPTDNFYKFLAVAGLMAAGFCFLYPIYSKLGLIDLNARAAVEGKYVMDNVDRVMDERDRLRVSVKTLESKTPVSGDDSARLKDERQRLDLVEERLDKLNERNMGIMREFASSEAKIRAIDLFTPEAWRLGCFFFLVTTLGFVLWKTRHQDLQDRLLKAEVELKEAQVRASLGLPSQTGKGTQPSLVGVPRRKRSAIWVWVVLGFAIVVALYVCHRWM